MHGEDDVRRLRTLLTSALLGAVARGISGHGAAEDVSSAECDARRPVWSAKGAELCSI